MIYFVKTSANVNGQDMSLTPLDIDYANRIISITGEIDEETATVVSSALRSLARNSSEDITIYIQSPGGMVTAGFFIYDTAKSIKCDIRTVACGMAASMAAFLLAAAGTKGKRYAHPNEDILIHQPLGGESGQATDILIHAEHILNTRKRLNSILAECTGQSFEKIDADTERDYILNAEMALEYGLIDIIGDPITEEL